MGDFAGYSKAKVSAADFDALCSSVFDAAKSLASCKAHEVSNEANWLRDATNRLAYADLSRKNERLSQRRLNALAVSQQVLARRSAAA